MRPLLCVLLLCASAFAQDGWRATRVADVALDESHRVNWLPASTQVGWRDCYEACVRIQQGTTFGSGGVFQVDRQSVWILTNAHVVGSAPTVGVEFFRQGYKSQQVTGRVHYRKYDTRNDVDMAIVAVPRALFGNAVPRALPLGRDPQPGQQVLTTGCPRADWPALWSGHVVSVQGNIIYMTPGPKELPDGGNMMSGRSGSVICNAEGTEIVGLIAWSNTTHGMGQRISHVVRSAVADEAQLCGPFGCKPQQPPYQQPPYQSPPNQGPWPQLPPEGDGGAASGELAELRARVASLEQDRQEFVREWTRLKAIAHQVEQDLPELRRWVQSTGDQRLQEAAAYAETLVKQTSTKIDRLETEVEKAAGIKGWAQEQLGDLRADLKAYGGDLINVRNAIDLVARYRENRADDHSAVESIKLTLAQTLGELKQDLKSYGTDKAVDAKEAALGSLPDLAIKMLPWPLATVASVALWAWRRRREPEPPAAQYPAAVKS